ncbi:MAG: translation initiation factor IF-3 [Phycisphaerales bacterium]|nr:translation initiation factor IF-3 [Phycisphaerales bacterium]
MNPRDQQFRRERINDMIRFSPLRVIGPDNEQLGVIPLEEAKRLAQEAGLDLVEISADSRPPVCKIMDFGRYKYEQSKKEKRSAGGSKKSELKEVRLGRSLKIDPHDVEIRVEQARGFILDGHKVQFVQPMRGREFQYRDQGIARLKEIEQRFADIGKVEMPAKFTGRAVIMIIAGDRSKILAYKKAHPGKQPENAPAAAETSEDESN